MKRIKGPFTGYHMTAILVAFFGVVMAVNFTMAKIAVSGFGGTVVDNSYVASQKYNDWLEEARVQEKSGWRLTQPQRLADNRLSVQAVNSLGKPLEQIELTILAEHPVGLAKAQSFTMRETAAGTYESDAPLPKGRWKLKLAASKGALSYKMASDIL